MMRSLLAVFAGLLISLVAYGAIDTYDFRDEAERERYRTLTEELRCPKCQNQNIADSNAPIAMDLRKEIFRMLEEGQSNDQIIDYLVARYGDFVRYRPPVTKTTLLLWYGPAALLILGLGVLAFIIVRRRRVDSTPAAQTLTEAERQRLASLLDKKEP